MFTLEQIEAIGKKALSEKWTYPLFFNALRDIGVERYEVNVLTHEILYVGGGSSLPAPVPAGSHTLELGKKFDADGVVRAIKRSQAGDITYPQFLAEIAAAGIPFYRVDMKPRVITYHGQDRRDKHVEKVPEV